MKPGSLPELWGSTAMRWLVATLSLAFILPLLAGPDPATQIYRDENDELLPFYSAKMELVWKVPPDSLPTRLNILQAAPSAGSPTAISNLLALIGMNPGQKAEVDAESAEIMRRFNFLQFQSRNKSAYFSEGTRCFILEDGDVSRLDPFRNNLPPVPTESQMTAITRRLLPLIDLPAAEMHRGADGEIRIVFGTGETSAMGRDGTLVSATNRVYSRIDRRYAGFEFLDQHGLTITARSGGRLERVDVRWPGVAPVKTLRPPSRENLMGFISSGQARSLDSGAPGTEQVRVSDIRRFTISSVVFQWVTKPSPTDSKHSPTRYVPMARLAGSVELRSGRKIGMSVMSPATIDLPVRSRRTDGEVPAFNE